MRDVLDGVDLPIGATGRLRGGRAGIEETEKRRDGDIPNAEWRAEARNPRPGRFFGVKTKPSSE
jgi:hypothetical protein